MPLCITCYDAELLLCLWRYVLRVTSFCYLSVQPTTMLNQGEALMSCSNGPWCCSGIADDHEVGYNDQNDNFMSVIVKSWLYKYSFMNPSKYFLDFLMNPCACRKSNQPTLLHRAEERHWQWCAPTELKNTTLVTVVTLSSILTPFCAALLLPPGWRGKVRPDLVVSPQLSAHPFSFNPKYHPFSFDQQKQLSGPSNG